MIMGKIESFKQNLLTIEVEENQGTHNFVWTGKSIDRNPGSFITPILVNGLKRGLDAGKRVVMDFRKLEYMNSSTITPIIKLLDRAKRGKNQITIIYDNTLKWQELSFSAMEIFQTKDRRIEIKGAE